MKNFFNRTAALLALLCYFSNAACAGEWAAGFAAGRRTLDLYLERAKIQTDQSRFEKIAEEGISAALFEWERGCEDSVLCDSAEWKAQRAAFERELGEAAEQAFGQWLLERKEENSFAVQKAALYLELQKAAADFALQSQDESQSSVAGAEQIQEAEERWKALAEEIVQKYLDENFSEQEKTDFYFAESKVCNELMNEFLLGKNSQKNQNASRAAFAVADNLASQIESESERAVSELFNSLEKEAQTGSAGQALPKSGQKEKWLAQFEIELRRGLQKWEEAEEEFLAARAAWELEAESLYESESLKWQEAWNELLERKDSWGKKIAAQIQEGELEWQKKFGDLDEEISNYMRSFQESLAMELEQKNWIVQSQAQSYERCRAILKTAKDGIENWGAGWVEKYKGLYSYWKSEDSEFWENFSERSDSTYDLKTAVQKWKRDLADSLKDIFYKARGKMEELSASDKKLYKLYYSTLEEFGEHESQIAACNENSSAEEIAAASSWICSRKEDIEEFLGDGGERYLQTLSESGALWNSDAELFEWLALFDKHSAMSQALLNSFSKSVNLGESACSELSVKQKAAAAYLESCEERVQIAQAVYDYAQSQRIDDESAAQNEENLSRALAVLEDANAEYQRLLDEARQMEAEAEKAREGYLALLDESSEAMERLEAEREKLRELLAGRSSIYSPAANFPAIFELMGRLESLDAQSGDFEKMLFAFAKKIQEPEKESFLERVQEMRSAVENGSDGISCDSSKIEGLSLSEEFESAKESLDALAGSQGKTLSMASLSELSDGLEEILSGGEIAKEDILALIGSLKILDADGAKELNEKLADWPDGSGGGNSGSGNSGGGNSGGGSGLDGGLEDEIRDCLKKLLELCDLDLENREAALLLLDGSADEIHEFFDGNDDFSQVFDNYKDYSAALLDERQNAVRERVVQVIESGSRSNLSDYFEALDLAAEGLDAAGKEVLELCKTALERQSKYANKENLLNYQLSELLNFGFNIRTVDWRAGYFEKYFLDESGGANLDGLDDYDEDLFNEILNSPAEALDKIQHYVDCMKNPSKMLEQLEASIMAQDAVVKAAQDGCECAMLAAVDDSPGSALDLYSIALARYNDLLDQCFEAQQKVKAVRRDYRAAEEIWFYGQNEYLCIAYDAGEKLSDSIQERDSAKAELDALNAIERGLRTEDLLAYEQSYVQYNRIRALAYKHQKSMSAQADALALAQAQERAALDRIVAEASTNLNSFKVPAAARDLVALVQENDGSRSIRLTADANSDGKNEERLFAYYTNLQASETDANGVERRYSFARQDAISFLESLEGKPYSLVDLALAALCVEVSGDFSSRAEWLKNGADPEIDDFYKIGDLPDQVHGVDLASGFRAGRMETVKDAYLRVVAAGGQDDIARYILHAGVNFSQNLGLEEMQRNALMASALNEPIGEAKSAGSSWMAAADALYVSAAALGAVAAIPFVGAWAIPIVTALAPFAEAFASAGKKLLETASDMALVQKGCAENLKAGLENYGELFSALNEARENLNAESERFASLDGSGGEKKPISWSDFSAALSKMFRYEKNSGYIVCLNGVLAAADGQTPLKEFFESLSSESPFYSVSEALGKMLFVLGDKESQAQRSLNSYLAARAGDLSFDEDAFLANLLDFYSNEVIKNLPANFGDALEDYQADAFSAALELREKLLANCGKNKLEEKKAVFAVMYDDLAREYSDWKEKCELILKTADVEWKRAAERIQSGFNAWQAEWSALYEGADEEWRENYSGFLTDKQNWIYSQYIGSPAIAASSEWTAKAKAAAKARLQDKTAVDELVSQASDSKKFERVSALAENLAAIAKNDSLAQDLLFLDRQNASVLRDIASLAKASRELQEETQKAAAKCAFQALQRRAEETLEDYLKRVDEQNKSFEKWELEMVRASGYTVDPLIHRDAVVGSTLLETKRETQWVHRYEWFKPERPKLNFDSSLVADDSQDIMAKADDIERTLTKWAEKIFGTEDSPNGDFSRHIGEAPVFVEKPNAQAPLERNVENWGAGQLGLIMLDCQWNSIRNSEGYAELSKALYDQQLFDTGIDGLKLPTIRDVASVVCDIVSTYPPLYFVKYVDDTVFGAIDLGMGFKSWEEVLNESIRQGMIGAVSYGVGAAASAIGNAVQEACKILEASAASHIFNAAKNAATGYLTNGLSESIKAVDFVRGTIDWEEAADAWLGSSALTSVAGTMLGGALNAGLMVDANGNALNGSLFANAYKATAAIGSLSGAALNYMLTGDFSVNLASVRGVGFLEVGVKDGQFFGGYGRDGLNLSWQALSSFASSAKDLSKINGLRLGGEEDRALLSVENQLAWSGRSANYELASALWNGGVGLRFEEGAGNGKLLDGVLVMDKGLLGQGKEGAALLATFSALQNSAQNGGQAIDQSLLSALPKKADGSSYSEEEVRAALDKLKTDEALSGLIDAGAAASISRKMLGLPASSQNALLDDFAALGDAYRENGMAGAFSLYAAAAKRLQEGEKGVSGLAELLERPFYQNDEKNLGLVLGFSLAKDEYNKIARQNAIDRFVNERVEKARKSGASSERLAEVERETRAAAESEIRLGVKSKKYSYDPQSKASDLYGYGCALATAAYVAYSITGQIVTLDQANEILKANGLYENGTDKNGVTERNRIYAGEGYAAAVNAIAGKNYLQADGSISAEIKNAAGMTIGDNRQAVYDGLRIRADDASDVYFTHLRVNDRHSVLLDSIDFGDGKDYKTSSFTVMDPWAGGTYGPKNGWADITRADFYKLTQSGRDMYALTRAALRAAAG